MLSLYYHELMWKNFLKKDIEKKYLMVDDYVLDKVLDKIKEIKKINDTMILKQMINCQMILLYKILWY